MAPTISPEEWELRKPTIRQLYLDEGLELQMVMNRMKAQGFIATKSQYTTKLKAWDYLKNADQLPRQVWEYVEREFRKRKRENSGDDIEVIVDGVLQNPAKVRKEISRHFSTTLELVDGRAPLPSERLVSVHTLRTWSSSLPWLHFSARFLEVNGSTRVAGRDDIWSLSRFATSFDRQTGSSSDSNEQGGLTELIFASSVLSGQRKSASRLATDMAIYMPGPSKDHFQRSEALLKGQPGTSLRTLLGVLIFKTSNNMASHHDWNTVFAMIRQSGWMKSSRSELTELRSTEHSIAAFLEKLFQQSFEEGDWDFISWLLDLGVPPDTRVGGSTGVVYRYHLPIVAALGDQGRVSIPSSTQLERHKLLLQYGASATELCCLDHLTSIHHAIRMGCLKVVQLYDLREHRNFQDLMHLAVTCQHDANGARMIQYLVRIYESTSQASEDIFTRVKEASRLNTLTEDGCEAMLQLLSDNGVDFNCHDEQGSFPLGIAVRKGRTTTVRLLLRLGARANYDAGMSKDGRIRPSVLHLVESKEMCEILLESGAITYSPAHIYGYGTRPFTALLLWHIDLKNYDVARLLAAHGPPLESPELLFKLYQGSTARGLPFLAVLEAIHNRDDLRADFREKVANMIFMDKVFHSKERQDIRAIEAYIKRELPILVSSGHYVTMLTQAVRWRRLEILKAILGKADISLRQEDLLLHKAFKVGCQSIIDIILANFPDAYSPSALCTAIIRLTSKAKSAEYQLDALLQRRCTSVAQERRETQAVGLAVRHACITGDFGLLNEIDPGACANICHLKTVQYPYACRTSPLALALFNHDPDKAVTRVIDLDYCNPSRSPQTLETLLGKGYKCQTLLGHLAVKLGLLEHLKLLVASGFNPRRRYAWASTVLQCAVEREDIPMVKYLLQIGADINAPPPWQSRNELAHLGQFNRYLGSSRRTALQSAAQSGNLELVELLLIHGADINAAPCSNSGGTALQLACIGGFTGLVKLLLSEGADPNAPKAKINGRTALEGAAEHGRLDTVELLLCEGCKITDLHRKQFISAIRLATKEGHATLAKRLQDFGKWTREDEKLRCSEEFDQAWIYESFPDEDDVSDVENPSVIDMPSFTKSNISALRIYNSDTSYDTDDDADDGIEDDIDDDTGDDADDTGDDADDTGDDADDGDNDMSIYRHRNCNIRTSDAFETTDLGDSGPRLPVTLENGGQDSFHYGPSFAQRPLSGTTARPPWDDRHDLMVPSFDEEFDLSFDNIWEAG